MKAHPNLINQLVHFGNKKKRVIITEIEERLLQIRNEEAFRVAKSGKYKKRHSK